MQASDTHQPFTARPSIADGPGLSGPTMTILSVLIAALALIVAALTYGPVVLTLAALALVPVMFVFFIAISRP